MASANTQTRGTGPRTHEGTPAGPIGTELQLRRALMSCLLWENQFYESGQDISERLKTLVQDVPSEKVAQMMIEARRQMYLRHAPLWIACCLAEKGQLKAEHVDAIIQRPDELAELVALWWKDGKRPMKKGLARALLRFDAHQIINHARRTWY